VLTAKQSIGNWVASSRVHLHLPSFIPRLILILFYLFPFSVITFLVDRCVNCSEEQLFVSFFLSFPPYVCLSRMADPHKEFNFEINKRFRFTVKSDKK